MTENIKMNIKSDFFKLAIPSVLSMWVYTIYTMVDGMFVAKGVGPNALAAVNISMPLINTAFGLSILWAVGASTKASIYRGKKEFNKANQVFTSSTLTVFFIGLFISIFGYFNIDFIANLLGSTTKTHTYVKDYLSIIIIFVPFYMTAYNLEVLIKADGYPKKAVTTILIGAITNIFLDYLFVIKFSFGIKGAAVATGLSQFITFLIFLSHYNINKNGFRFIKIIWKLKDSFALAKIGAADSLTEFSIATITFMFNHVLLKTSGSDALVIYTVISYVYQLVLMTMMGLNQGMQPLVSYYYGKNDKKTYKYILKVALVSAGLASIISFLIGFFLPKQILSLFISKDNVILITNGIRAFKLFSFAFLPVGFVIIIYGYFTAIENSKNAITISLFRGWIFVILSLISMAYLFKETGVWLSLSISESLSLLLAIYLYNKSKGNIIN